MTCEKPYTNMIGEEVICGTINRAGVKRRCKECSDKHFAECTKDDGGKDGK